MNPKPKLPRGYRWLKVGQTVPKGAKLWDKLTGRFSISGLVGSTLYEISWDTYGPYIAPIIKRPAKGAKLPSPHPGSWQARIIYPGEEYSAPYCAVLPCSTLTEARALVKRFNGRAKK